MLILRRKFVLAMFLLLGLADTRDLYANEDFESSTCKAEVLMEANQGKILSEVNSEQKLPPASMVKMMTAYVVFKKVQMGEYSWDDVVTVSAFASKIGGSQVYLKEKEEFTLKQLVEALMIQSANDAAVAIAEHIGGTQSGFVEMMNAEAEMLGMTESRFQSAHGLPPAAGQKSDLVTPRDMAKLAQALVLEFPDILEITSTQELGFRNDTFIMRNHNNLVKKYPGCDGLKTGFFYKAGFCVTATAKKNDLRLIAVVMGCESSKKRDAEAARLLSYGFARYRSHKVIEKGAPIEEAVDVVDAIERKIIPVAKDDLTIFTKREDHARIVKDVRPCTKLVAPIKAGTQCGEVVVTLDGEELGRTDLIVDKDYPRLGLKDRVLRKFGF